ncbi:hypothetical protein Glove_313g27 [Diversispora epigaea]|uniref:BACK domain-containing protein n=1 Tax=Diversispora epigaea TaxID=1348612 RepID=A0A397HRH4_9GLOM|nr:hypothetical protein Glove_313g27 [Diversispora epigaea]
MFANWASWLRLKFAQIYRTNALISILKRDDLLLEEVKILEYIIQWESMSPTNWIFWSLWRRCYGKDLPISPTS